MNSALTLLTALIVAWSIPVKAEEVPSPDPLSQIPAEHLMISTDSYDETIAWHTQKLGHLIKQEWTVPEFPGVKLAHIELNGFLIGVV